MKPSDNITSTSVVELYPRANRGRLIRSIKSVRYHRNGCFGTGFFVVQFSCWARVYPQRGCATVFEERGSVAVVDLDNPDECWRGDEFEPELRAAIDAAGDTAFH